MLVKILFAGAGGQGVLTAGNVLANAAMVEDYYVTYLPSYGAAVRGGTANCTICISDEEIASPVASSPDFIVALNKPSANAFINRLEPGGQMIYNSSLIESVPYRGDVDLFSVPANAVASEIGNERAANMVILGSFIKLTNILKINSLKKSIEYMMSGKKKLIDISKRAVEEGYQRFPFESNRE
jgi:2-oxoacid:acceptor oxidoreductase gamma subunit (pyruvate/2-ketoisovalerate family)